MDGLDVVVEQTNRYHNSHHDFQKGKSKCEKRKVIIILVIKPR